jgi:hypothetical protein
MNENLNKLGVVYFNRIKNAVVKKPKSSLLVTLIGNKPVIIDDLYSYLSIFFHYIPDNMMENSNKSYMYFIISFNNNHIKTTGFEGKKDIIPFIKLTSKMINEKIQKYIGTLDTLKFCKVQQIFLKPSQYKTTELENLLCEKYMTVCSVCKDITTNRLSKCLHYLCVVCFKKMIERKCPLCRCQIVEYRTQCDGFGDCDDCRDYDHEEEDEDNDLISRIQDVFGSAVQFEDDEDFDESETDESNQPQRLPTTTTTTTTTTTNNDDDLNNS